MPELIERGYIYIAQPPLYKVKKGKQEQYIKDEDAMDQYQVSLALDNAGLYVNSSAPAIAGEALEELVQQYNKGMKLVDRMTRRYPRSLVHELVYVPRLTAEMCQSESEVEVWGKRLVDQLNAKEVGASQYSLQIEKHEERNISLAKIVIRTHGVIHEYVIGLDLLATKEYNKLANLSEALDGLIEEGAYIKRGERTLQVDTFSEALEWLRKESRRGLSLQRYKGLGEMNPDQLWETTMDPETRRMMRVTIEDAVGADQLFTTLMGDQVEPRRNFIEENALKVANLDV
jgi:DNA gyrase subunit B